MAFSGLCVIFYHDRKKSPGCQNHNLGVQSKNLGGNFLSQMFFRNIFRFWAEELGNLAEKYWQGCQNHIHWFRRNTFIATFLKQVCKYFNLFGLLVKFPWQQRKINFRVDRTAKKVSRSKLRKDFSQKKKNILF